MHESDIKGGCPSIAPEKLLRAMLLQILFSVRSLRQLKAQTRYRMWFRWFIGLEPDGTVWGPTAFSENRRPLIGQKQRLPFASEVLEAAENKDWLSASTSVSTAWLSLIHI